MTLDIPKLVINLPERKDRMERFVQEMKYLDLPDITIIEGVKNDLKPMVGIAEAHKRAIEYAKDWDHVLIMEDDCVFQGKERTLPYLTEALKNVPEDWDVLLGGLYECKRMAKTNKYWSKVGEFCGLHFYILNKKAHESILAHDGNHHIDRWVNKGGNKLNVYVLNKFIATQSQGFSDNVKKRVDYSDRIKRFTLL